MDKGIFTISRPAEISLEIKKSRFVARSFLCASEDSARDTVRDLRETERNATHHCWAYRIGLSGDKMKYDNSGEPRGTAGPPILEALKIRNLTNTLVVVTRFYGGIKLGVGGLLRAYAEAANRVLEESRPVGLRLMKEIMAPVSYGLLSQFESYLSREKFPLVDKEFGEHVVVIALVPAERESEFLARHAELVNGRLACTVIGERYV